MRPLLHFSEDPTIALFRPHVSRTSHEPEPFVWAIDREHAPSYWFPRDCPRACCWAGEAPIPEAGYWVSSDEVSPLSVTPIGDLLDRHIDAGIELRLVTSLWLLIDAIVASDLEFSIIRKANARQRHA